MPHFSKDSQQQINTCHHDVQAIFKAVEHEVDCEVRCGHRTQSEQEKCFAEGHSGFHWPESRHNAKPSMAVDVIPVDMDPKDIDRWHWFGGYVKGVADRLYAEGVVSHRLHWAGDKGDQELCKFPHFEIYMPH